MHADGIARDASRNVAGVMAGNAARVQANKELTAKVMAAQAAQAGQIAQANAMAAQAQHAADAEKYKEDAKMKRLERVLGNI